MPGSGNPVDHSRNAEGMQQGKAGFPPQVPDLGASTDPAKPHPHSGGSAGPRPAQMAAIGWERGCVWPSGEAPSGADPFTVTLTDAPALTLGPCLSDADPMPEPGHGSCWSHPWFLAWLWTYLPYRCVWRWQSLPAIPRPALLALLCPAHPTDSWMTFPCWANPLWLLPNILPSRIQQPPPA